jgi:hypothetical protein
VNFRRSVVYGLATLRTLVAHRRQLGQQPASGTSERSPAGSP